ncbi:MAG: glutamate 5-kinase [Candidatus Nanopelagicales bacterium]
MSNQDAAAAALASAIASRDLRAAVASAERVVIKAGSSSLTTPDGQIDYERVNALVDVVARVTSEGRQVVLVSSGAIASGIGPLGLSKRPRDLATAQAAASVGQGVLIGAYASRFASHGRTVGQVLLTSDDIGRRIHYRNAQRTLDRLLELGIVPIVNENDTVATDEIRFGDNDRLAALVAHLVRAQALVLLSDVDALYDGPPSEPGSAPVSDVFTPAQVQRYTVGGIGSHVGSGGMKTKVQAAQLATDAGIPVVLTSAAKAADVLFATASSQRDEDFTAQAVGTLFHPSGRRRPSRLLWLEHGSEAQGQITLDDGAVRALTTRKASLLPAGIIGVTGTFEVGDPIELVAADGAVIGRGIVSFDSSELPALMGRSTKDLAAELGAGYEREVVHRDDLVITGN